MPLNAVSIAYHGSTFISRSLLRPVVVALCFVATAVSLIALQAVRYLGDTNSDDGSCRRGSGSVDDDFGILSKSDLDTLMSYSCCCCCRGFCFCCFCRCCSLVVVWFVVVVVVVDAGVGLAVFCRDGIDDC